MYYSYAQGVLLYLTETGVTRTPVSKPLFDPEQDEEETEGIDNEQFLTQLAGMRNWICIYTHV